MYPRLVKNPRFLPNKKNKGVIPEIKDIRQLYVPVACGVCAECRRKKYNSWKKRLIEEKKHQRGYFLTLTFSDEALEQLKKEAETEDNNAIAKFAMRRFLERYRKKNGKSCKHWFITELGGQNDRIHLHGIVFENPKKEATKQKEWTRLWKYGHVWAGWCNDKTISYVSKYILKQDIKHKDFKGIILCSAGIGAAYRTPEQIERAKLKLRNKQQITYRMPNGAKSNMPDYYRRTMLSDEEREKDWSNTLDRKKRYVRGLEIDVSTKKGMNRYFELLKEAQEWNVRMGYGEPKWNKKEYKISLQKVE